MKKRIFLFVFLVLLSFSLFAATSKSLLSDSTNRLFTNAIDKIIRPNADFNSIKNDYVIALGDMGLNTGSSSAGSAELGYFHSSKYPFAISTALNMRNIHDTEGGSSSDSLDWGTFLRFTIGVPEAMDLSLGLILDTYGNKNMTSDKWSLSFALPFGMQIGPVYNYMHPYFEYESKDKLSGTVAGDKDKFTFALYDEVSFFSLIPGGVETNVWLLVGTDAIDSKKMPFIEDPSFPHDGDDYDISGQVGISNRYDFSPISTINLLVNPKVYLDWNVYETGFMVGFSIASDVGLYYRPKDGIFGTFFAMTPRLVFGYMKNDDGYSYSNFSTEIVWSGRLGVSLFLPRDITLDVACAVNTVNNPFEIKVQMAFTL